MQKVLKDGDKEDHSLASQAVKASQMEEGLEQQRKELVPDFVHDLILIGYVSGTGLNQQPCGSNLQGNSLRIEVPSLELQELQELAEEAARQDCHRMHLARSELSLAKGRASGNADTYHCSPLQTGSYISRNESSPQRAKGHTSQLCGGQQILWFLANFGGQDLPIGIIT